MKSQMDAQISSMGESCTLREYTEVYDADGYMTSSSYSDSTATIFIDPFTQKDWEYTGQGVRTPATLRALLKSDITLNIITNRYDIIGEDGVVYEIVSVEDELTVEGVKCGTDVNIRRRDLE